LCGIFGGVWVWVITPWETSPQFLGISSHVGAWSRLPYVGSRAAPACEREIVPPLPRRCVYLTSS